MKSEPPQQPKEYIVSLGMMGEILDIEESPLSKASGNDLYGVQVYSKTSTTDYTPYAYGLFDDKSLMTIKLLEGYTYKFKSTMVVNGKNRIQYLQGQYWAPFMAPLENKFIFNNEHNHSYIENGYASLCENKAANYPNLERYYGEFSGYTPTEGGNISINMKRVCFGAKFIIEGLTEGKLRIAFPTSADIEIDSGENNEFQDIFTFKNPYPSGMQWTKDDYSEIVKLTISWVKLDGAVIPLINKDIIFKRNILTTITIKVKDTTMDNNIDITHETGEMTKGEDIVLESGTGLDGTVNPS